MARIASGRAKTGNVPLMVAICGNPNSGKTTVFNAITGLNQRVANYPGVTVEKVTGRFTLDEDRSKTYSLIDVPGTYSLAAFSPDEFIAASALFGFGDNQPDLDAIICVADATNMERALYLLLQVLEIGRPVVVALNMFDVARKHGLRIDTGRLSSELGGVPVVPVVANHGWGIADLKRAVAAAVATPSDGPREKIYDDVTERVMADLKARCRDGLGSRAELLRVIFDRAGPAEEEFLRAGGDSAREALDRGREAIQMAWQPFSAAETSALTRRAGEIFRAAVTQGPGRRPTRSEKVDRFLLHPVFGPVILGLIMLVVFQAIFSWAEPFMHLIDSVFAKLAALAATVIPQGPVQSLVTDGIIGGVGSVLVFVPQIAILFIFIALLEDTGYMARAAFLVDRLFRWCGLSGKSFIPMLSSFACAVPGIMATRTIEDRRLRIVTIMVSPLMTCSARLPVYAIMIAAFVPYRTYLGIFNLQGAVLTLLYLLGIAVAVLVSLVLSRTLLKTKQATFLMEMPGYKLPMVKSVVARVLNRVKSFVVRAGTVILAITVIIWALSYYPHDAAIGNRFAERELDVRTHYDAALVIAQNQLDQAFERAPGSAESLSSRLRVVFEGAEDRAQLERLRDKLVLENPTEIEAVEAAYGLRQLTLERQTTLRQLDNERAGWYIRDSYFGRMGRLVEPVFRPLGWDWKITMATLASFPAREVIIATLGTIYNLGADRSEITASLVERMRRATWQEGPRRGRPVFTLAVALSIMVFFALCCQCGATIVTIRHETGRWLYSAATFLYMTAIAYVLALITYRVALAIGLGPA